MHIVVFDLDNTLIKGNVSCKFFFYLFLKKQISLFKLVNPFFKFIGYYLGLLSLTEMHNLVFEGFLKNQDLNFLKKNITNFLQAKMKKMINYSVFHYLKQHLAQNDFVILMSSSPDFIVGPLAEMLNVKKYFATEYASDSNGKINDITCFLDGATKAKLLKNLLTESQLSFDKIIGFSDSIDDLPLLEICNQVYLVKPKIKLKKKFNQKSCIII